MEPSLYCHVRTSKRYRDQTELSFKCIERLRAEQARIQAQAQAQLGQDNNDENKRAEDSTDDGKALRDRHLTKMLEFANIALGSLASYREYRCHSSRYAKRARNNARMVCAAVYRDLGRLEEALVAYREVCEKIVGNRCSAMQAEAKYELAKVR